MFRENRRPDYTYTDIFADHQTCENIRIMVNRSRVFFDRYGPVTIFGPTFRGGYTELVRYGDGDYATYDTIWDFKVSKREPTKDHTLQLAMYYLLAKHSGNDSFDHIHQVGIFNPRTNTTYILDMKNIPDETIGLIERKIIGYC